MLCLITWVKLQAVAPPQLASHYRVFSAIVNKLFALFNDQMITKKRYCLHPYQRRRFLLGAVAWLGAPPAIGGLLDHIDWNSPAMSQPDMTLAEVKKLLTNGAVTDFRHRRLSGLDLSGLSFRGADLRWARFNRTKLVGADLRDAQINSAWFAQADLTAAKLANISGQNVQMPGAIMRDADLSGARLIADLTRADLRKAVFHAADLAPDMSNQSMGLTRTILFKANAENADFSGADMSWVDAEFCSFRGTDLRGTIARYAKLGGADLQAANVLGLDVSGADLTSTNLQNMIGGESALVGLSKANNLSRARRDK